MGVDFEEGALPAEAGLDDTIDVTKGCFLGQESVAKIRNLGHPPTVLRHRRSEACGRAGRTAPRWTAHEAGSVTSAVAARGAGPSASPGSSGRRARPSSPPRRCPFGACVTGRTSPFESFPVPLPGVTGLPAFDPFRWTARALL